MSEIKPAMTPDEWRMWREDCERMGDVGTDSPDDTFMFMAMQNERLPAENPRKITRADITDLRRATAHIPDHMWERARDADRIIAKLAALLPPA